MCHVPFLHLACMPIGQYYYCSEDVYHATHLSSCLQTQFYDNLNSLGCISMTLKHVYQGQLPCLELEYRGRAGKKKRPLSVNQKKKRECGLDTLNECSDFFWGLCIYVLLLLTGIQSIELCHYALINQSFLSVWLHLEPFLKMES